MCTHVSAACVRRKKSGGSGGGRTRAARRGSRRRVQHVDLATRESLPAHAPGTHARARCGREGPEARQSRCGGSAARAPTTCRPRRCAVAMRRRAVPSSRRGATAAAPSSRRQRRAYHRSRCGRRRVLFLEGTCLRLGTVIIKRRANTVAGRERLRPSACVSTHQVWWDAAACLGTDPTQDSPKWS